MNDKVTIDGKEFDADEWVPLVGVASADEAEIIKATLAFAQIPGMVYGETGLGKAYGLLGAGVATSTTISVMVPAGRFAEARNALSKAKKLH